MPVENTELRDGMEVGPYNLLQGEIVDFFMEVSTYSAISCETKGSYGDLTLFMDWENVQVYECVTTSVSSRQTCFLGPNTGIAKIRVQASSAVIGFTITCTAQSYAPLIMENMELTNGVEAGPYNMLTDESLDFFINVPLSSAVTCKTFVSNGSQHLRKGGLRINMDWEDAIEDGCTSHGYNMPQDCSLERNTGMAKIKVKGWSPVIGFFIRCTAEELISENMELTNGVEAGPYNLDIDDSLDFSMNIPVSSAVSCETYHTIDDSSMPSGALTLGMKWDNAPEDGCTSEGDSMMQNCFLGPSTGMAMIKVHSLSPVSNLFIKCSVQEYSQPTIENAELSNGIATIC